MGSEGVRLAKEVVDLTVKQRENATNLASITREYNTAQPFDHPNFDEFLKVDEIEDIDTQIDEQTKQLNSFKNQEGICSQLSTMIESLGGVDLVAAKNYLEATLTVDISKITSHIHDNMPESTRGVEAEEFLRQGLKLSTDQNVCPFCAQATENDDTQELLQAYSDYFSESYNAMAQNRQVQAQYFTRWDVVSKLRKGVIELSKLDVAIDLHGADEKIEEAIAKFVEEIEKKKDFAYQVDFTLLDTLKEECTTLISRLEATLEQYEGDLSGRIKSTKDTLRDYEVAKKRHSEPWKTKAKDYQDLKAENDIAVTPQLNAAIEAQSAYANTIYSGCMSTVNECLAALGVNFKVQNLSYKGRTRNDLFTLVFDDTHTVAISTGSRVSSHTSKHTLSESDRRALCFAFFVASIMSDPKCSELIIVLDDPVSSFDSDRRNNTVKYLKRLRETATTPCQFITLTHDKDFLRTLASDIRNHATNLMLEWSPANNTSDFTPLDVSTHPMFMDEYYRKLNELEQNLLLPDSSLNTGHLQNVRHVIENIMKRKYYKLLADNIRDKKSLGTFIETLSAPGNPYEHNQALPAHICSLLPHEVHHDQDNPGGYDVSAIGANDIRRIITDTLSVIQSI